jgi:hypothetical protein
MTLSTFIASISLSTITFAQSNDQVIDSLLWTTATRWYTAGDKSAVRIIAKTSNTVTIEAPLAKKDNKNITSYYITWAPISYKNVTASSNTDDLKSVKTSDDTKAADGGPMYKIENGKLIFTINITEPTKDLYVTIAPEDANKNTWWMIEDFKFNINTTTSTTAVAGDIFNSTNNKAIDNISCVWDATANRVTWTWDINTAMNATKVEISHRPDENQWPMTVKGTPDITARRFVVETPHRNIQLFKFKPLDAADTMVGIEFIIPCKPDTIEVVTPPDSTTRTPITPTDPKKPIPVTPHTGPLETTAIIFFISLLGYFVYRKVAKH